jgi:hypothetical protein
VSIADSSGKVVRRLEAPATAGIHRIAWDLRGAGPNLPPPAPTGGRGGRGGAAGGGDEEEQFFGGRGTTGALVVPGKYSVTLAKRVDGVATPLPGSQTFDVVPEGPSSQPDRIALAEFSAKVAALQKALNATTESADDGRTRLDAIRRAIDATPSLPPKLHEQAVALGKQLNRINLALRGDTVWRQHNEGSPASIAERVQAAAGAGRGSTQRPTKTAMEQYQIASDELAVEIPKLRRLIDVDIRAIEKQLDAAGAPPTPGRLPDWKPK